MTQHGERAVDAAGIGRDRGKVAGVAPVCDDFVRRDDHRRIAIRPDQAPVPSGTAQAGAGRFGSAGLRRGAVSRASIAQWTIEPTKPSSTEISVASAPSTSKKIGPACSCGGAAEPPRMSSTRSPESAVPCGGPEASTSQEASDLNSMPVRVHNLPQLDPSGSTLKHPWVRPKSWNSGVRTISGWDSSRMCKSLCMSLVALLYVRLLGLGARA